MAWATFEARQPVARACRVTGRPRTSRSSSAAVRRRSNHVIGTGTKHLPSFELSPRLLFRLNPAQAPEPRRLL